MLIRGQELDINVEEELERFTLDKSRIRGGELICCSPFREEDKPSFSINLETGLWIDRGALSDNYKQGNLVKFLALLEEVSYEEITDYLIEKYGRVFIPADDVQLELGLSLNVDKAETIPHSKVLLYKDISMYLTNRGISEEVQELFETGIYKDNISLVWTDKKGEVVNIKYRNMNKKKFFYEDGGQPIKNHVYGLYNCIDKKADLIWICESEIDALTLWSCGRPAVALGSSSMSENQKKLLLGNGSAFVIAVDNDRVGNLFRKVLIEEFLPYKDVYDIEFPIGKKDINELSKEEIISIDENKIKIELDIKLGS